MFQKFKKSLSLRLTKKNSRSDSVPPPVERPAVNQRKATQINSTSLILQEDQRPNHFRSVLQ